MRPTVLALIVSTVLLFSAAAAQAGDDPCDPLDASGVWINETAQVNDIVRVTFKPVCSVMGFQHYRIKVETSCLPRNCTWGWSESELPVAGTVTTLFTTYSARRTVTFRINGDFMSLGALYDYNHAGRGKEEVSFHLARD